MRKWTKTQELQHVRKCINSLNKSFTDHYSLFTPKIQEGIKSRLSELKDREAELVDELYVRGEVTE